MYRGLLCVILILVLEPRLSQSSCEDRGAQRSAPDVNPSLRLSVRNLLKRYNDIDYDSFVGLMGRRSADADDMQSPRKREMHDIFVGLMGRRSSDADTGRPWRKDYPDTRGIFFNKCRLRFRRGL
ncbi:tachykinin-3a [Electrophorus electricus]|uniref:tachykinin-3a n=1 Tax=Electrophorus electricus TaxID=8005 RepID=UPI000F0A90D6|nr:tachykinin-3a [Electrophorus electricus]